MASFSRSGHIVDVVNKRIFPGTVVVIDGVISDIIVDDKPKDSYYIMPGFIDAHVHIESSMLVPSEFSRLASVHGTVATVSDPHEIANVLGIDGVRYMIDNSEKVPFHFCFGVPSCVPATNFETAGGEISPEDVETLFSESGLTYLSEMMNFPGVLHKDPCVMEKIAIAKRHGFPVDGHAPGLKGDLAKNYLSHGITTDHECFSLEEALDKIACGCSILIREGSAAKNYEALNTLIARYPEKVMFCSDDKHPHELVDGHINLLVRRSIVKKGYDIMDVLRAACLNPVQHYNLKVGLLQKGDSADFIVIDNLIDFTVKETYIKGAMVAKNGKALIESVPSPSTPNIFLAEKKNESDFCIEATSEKIHVIVPEEGQLITKKNIVTAKIDDGKYVSDIDRDILKICVVNRYKDAKPAIAFVESFGLKKGAIASCIAHDSHNIIAIGCTDKDICAAVNLLILQKGGIAAVCEGKHMSLPLPVAGIISPDDGYEVAARYAEIDAFAKSLGTTLNAPFMTLSFMALLVIPEIKLSDKGLFDGNTFNFLPLNAE